MNEPKGFDQGGAVRVAILEAELRRLMAACGLCGGDDDEGPPCLNCQITAAVLEGEPATGGAA
jgi:hypothetical protein